MLVDLDAVLNSATLDVWGIDVTYDPRASAPGRAPFTIRATFVREPVTVMTEVAGSELSAAGHSTVAPMIGVRRSDLGLDPQPEDRVTIGAETFTVWDGQPDTTGWIDIILRERV